MKYKENVLSIDSAIRLEFEKKFSSFLNSSVTIEEANRSFYNTFFKGASPLQTSAILTKFQNDVTLSENKLTTFCNLQIGLLDGHGYFSSYSAIISLNSKYVKAGDNIEIIAGLGAFSMAVVLQININGNTIVVGEEGYASYIFKAPSKPGKHFVPVKFGFTDQDGQKQTNVFTVEYTVAKPCDQ